MFVRINSTSETVMVFNAVYTEGSIWPLVWMAGDPCMLLPLPYGCGCGSLREFTQGFGSVTLLWREWHLSRTQLDKLVLFAIRETINEMEATERLFEIMHFVDNNLQHHPNGLRMCAMHDCIWTCVCVFTLKCRPVKAFLQSQTPVNSPPITDSLYPLQGKCHSIDSTLFLPCGLPGRFSNAL